VANYNVDIAVALKGAKELLKLKKDVKAVTQEVNGFNKALQTNANKFPKTINSLAEQVNKARTALKNAAVGTSTFTRAGEVLIRTQKALNKELAEEARILKQIETRRFGVAQSSSSNRVRRNVAESAKNRIDPKFKSLSLSGQSMPVEGRIERTLALKRDEIRLQEALLALEIKSNARQNEKLQIQGELNRQTALAVNNAKLRGQFSPLTSDIRGNIGDIKSRRESNILSSRRNQFGNVFTGRSGRDFGQIGGRIGPVEPIRSAGGFLSFSKRADEIAKGVKANVKQTTKTASLLAQQSARAAFTDMEFGVAGGKIGPATPFTRAERFGFGKRGQKAGGLFSFPGGPAARTKGGVGSAMIGGGFPLLFGAGGLSSILGGVAGGIGGALAPGGGFAASIAATALAAQIEKIIGFRKEVRNLNKDISSMGIESEFSRKQIKELAKEFNITNEEAVKLAATFKTFGADQAGTLLSAFGARDIFDSLSGLRDTESVLGKIQDLSGNISEEKRRELLQTIATHGPLEAQLKLQKEIIAIRRRLATEKKMKEFDFVSTFKDTRHQRYIKAFDTEIEREEFKLKKQKEFNEEFDKTNLTALELLENQIKINEQMQFLAEFRAPTDELRELLTPMRQVLDASVAIRDGFEESFKGIIKGTMTVGEAFRSMLNRIADHFLDSAARMAALQIQKGFLGLFSNMFNFNLGQSIFDNSGVQSSLNNPVVVPKAEGGPVKKGGRFLVGERGPELFTPGVSGMITPNHALGGSTSVVVNVDASGSSVEGDEQGGRELGLVLSAAIESELIKQKRPGGLLA